MPVGSLLGHQTKTFKSYGRLKHNTITRHKPVHNWGDDSPPRTSQLVLSETSSSESSDEASDEDSDEPFTPRRRAKADRAAALDKLKEQRGVVERPSSSSVTSATSKAKGKAKESGSKGSTKPVLSITIEDSDKENVGSSNIDSPRRGGAVFTKARARLVVQSPLRAKAGTKGKGKSKDTLSTEESDIVVRSPLQPRAGTGRGSLAPQSTTGKTARRPSPLRHASSFIISPTSSPPPPPISSADNSDSASPPRPARVRPSRARVIADSSSSESTDLRTPPRAKESPKVSAKAQKGENKEDEGDSTDWEERAPIPKAVARARGKAVVAKGGRRGLRLTGSPAIASRTRVGVTIPIPTRPPVSRQLERPASPPPVRQAPTRTKHTFPKALLPLLQSSLNPTAALDFTSFVTSPPSPFSTGTEWTKIGEASYSEVFSSKGEDGDDLVIKIIPVSTGVELGDDMPFASEHESVLREFEVSRLVGGKETGIEGFVGFKGAFIVQGAYPSELLGQWDVFKAAQRPPCDDQIRPHILPPSQVYAVICLSHGGSDLEHYKLANWTQAASVLWQVAEACKKGEESVEFEHRDLHWGNVLVRPTTSLVDELAGLALAPPASTLGSATTGHSLEPEESGVEATLIDFTLSRVVKKISEDAKVLFDGFEDELIFEGEGDHQFDIYRNMRSLVGDDWEGYHPLTNVMWLHYLVLKLLHDKKLKPPAPLPPSSTATSAPTTDSDRSRRSSRNPLPAYRSKTQSCPACTFDNPLSATSCEVCEAKLPAVGSSSSHRFAVVIPVLSSTSLTPRKKGRAVVKKSSVELANERRERMAYEGLVRIEKGLKRAVERGLGEVERKKKGSGKGKKGSAKKKGKALALEVEEDGGEGTWRSAGEFWEWWKKELGA
ncbi:serine/threonine protein kinase Haspin [Pseudohyphozyma bogoriensis]|nr:serine/threonine protein kinase Haspin [Pseudohyphozyma bogoriensis]